MSCDRLCPVVLELKSLSVCYDYAMQSSAEQLIKMDPGAEQPNKKQSW